MPPIPHTLEDVAVDGEWAVSWGGDFFVSAQRHPRVPGFRNWRKLQEAGAVPTGENVLFFLFFTTTNINNNTTTTTPTGQSLGLDV